MTDNDLQFANALSVILDAIEKSDLAIERKAPRQMKAFTLDELEAYQESGGPWFEDPVGRSLRSGVTDLGMVLASTRNTGQMREIAEKAAQTGGHYGIRINIVDKWWDGIKDHTGDVWIA